MERFGLKTWPGHCVIFLGKIIYFHSTSLYPGVKRLPALSGKPDEMLGGGGESYDGLGVHPGGSGNTPKLIVQRKTV